MAKRFHLSNGARLLSTNPESYNFEYEIWSNRTTTIFVICMCDGYNGMVVSDVTNDWHDADNRDNGGSKIQRTEPNL